MAVDCSLIGRDAELREVRDALAEGQSVLLLGPPGAGKSAIIHAVRRPEILVVDPFAGITTPHACALRRALNRGTLLLAAARSSERRQMGHVGRIFWRLRMVRVRPLSGHHIGRILCMALATDDAQERLPVTRTWLNEAVHVADGLPGRAVSLAGVVSARWQERHVLLPPRFALAVAWQDALLEDLRAAGPIAGHGVHPGQ